MFDPKGSINCLTPGPTVDNTKLDYVVTDVTTGVTNNATTQSINVTQSGSYTVTTTNSFGCATTSAAVAVNVPALSDTTITASGPTSF